jgi:hypothetical protein
MNFTKYGPKSELSPTIGQPCEFCNASLLAGDFTTLLSGRGNVDDLREVHWDCALSWYSVRSSSRLPTSPP